MELRDIEYFSVVAKHGHLGRAAEALGMSQSALSKCLRRLEQEMRAKLVKRTPKGVELTAEGSTLFLRTDRLRLSLDDIRREVADVSRGLAGHLRIGAGTGYAHHLLPAACNKMVKEAPNVTLNITFPGGLTETTKGLRNGEIDLLITMMRAPPEHDLVQEHLYDDEYVVCASANHRLARKKKVTLADVAEERWAVADPTFAIWRHLHKVFQDHGMAPPHIAVETGPQVVRFPVIASSDLLGYTWTSLVRQAMPDLCLVALHVKELELSFGVAVAYRKDAYLSPAARRFIDILKAAAKEIAKEP
jgi:DNA-binding transcriptional LysR family regulator